MINNSSRALKQTLHEIGPGFLQRAQKGRLRIEIIEPSVGYRKRTKLIFPCKFCHQKFSTAADAKRHALKHHYKSFTPKTRYQCRLCFGIFRSRMEILLHFRSKKPCRKKLVQCLNCDATFTLGTISKHLARMHGVAVDSR